MPDMVKTENLPATGAEIVEAHQWNEIIDSVAGKDHLTDLLNRRALVRVFGRVNKCLVNFFFGDIFFKQKRKVRQTANRRRHPKSHAVKFTF